MSKRISKKQWDSDIIETRHLHFDELEDCYCDCSQVKIIQLLLTPNNEVWQNALLGLGSDGVTYQVGQGTKWVPVIPPIKEKI